MDVDLLARLQFAFTLMVHYVFPPLSIGLGVLLVAMEATYVKTRDPDYEQMTKFWVRVFGLIFAVGVATGIVMEFQFGTNWSAYSRFVGDVFGSALAAEGIFAFFLASGFLAVLVFGLGQGPAVVTKNYAQLGITLPLYQSHGVASEEYIKLSGKAAEGRDVLLVLVLSLIHISEPTRLLSISYAVFCLKKQKNKQKHK